MTNKKFYILEYDGWDDLVTVNDSAGPFQTVDEAVQKFPDTFDPEQCILVEIVGHFKSSVGFKHGDRQ